MMTPPLKNSQPETVCGECPPTAHSAVITQCSGQKKAPEAALIHAVSGAFQQVGREGLEPPTFWV